MDVRTYMTTDVVTVSGTVRVLEALDMMKQHGIHRLPVVEGQRLVGLVTEGIIAQSTPSTATSLSMHELNYLLTKTTINQVMERHVITIEPDALLEAAAVTMRENNVGVLPVMEDGRLVGIITDKDIFDAFVDVLGYHTPGVRVVLEVTDHTGVLEHIGELMRLKNINIDQIAVYRQEGNPDVKVVLQVSNTDGDVLRELLTEQGYRVLSVIDKTGKSEN